jgi:hypothetical protein
MRHAGVRSTNLQCCLSRSLKSMPRRTMHDASSVEVVRQRVKSYPLSARNFLGYWRGRPVPSAAWLAVLTGLLTGFPLPTARFVPEPWPTHVGYKTYP